MSRGHDTGHSAWLAQTSDVVKRSPRAEESIGTWPRLRERWIFVGVSGASCTSIPYAVAISGFFDKRHGLALGTMLAGGGLGATLLPQLVQYLVLEVGWRAALLVVGGLAALLPTLGLILFVRTPCSVVQRSTNGHPNEQPASVRKMPADRHSILIVVSVLIGFILGAGSERVRFLVSRYFRFIDFSRLLGIVWVVWAWGHGFGTAVANWVFKVTDSDTPAFPVVRPRYASVVGTCLLAWSLSLPGGNCCVRQQRRAF